jgi:hypothetical protein
MMANFPFDPEELRKHALMPVVQFLTEYEIYLDHETEREEDFEASLIAVDKFIPKDTWPLLGASVDMGVKNFIRRNNLEGREKLPPFDNFPDDIGLYETLVFLLKSVWKNGYLLYKFRQFGYLPLPNHPVDPSAIADRVVSSGRSSDQQNFGANIEVFLQRAVSILTEPEAIKRPFQIFPDDVYEVVRPFRDDWADTVGRVYMWGILSAKAELELDEEKQAKVEYKVETKWGPIVIGPQIQGDFINAYNYIASVGDSKVAEALRHLTKGVAESDEISEEEKAELIQQLAELSRQAALPSDNRSSQGVLKAILASVKSVIGTASGLATVWSTWGETISKFFGF